MRKIFTPLMFLALSFLSFIIPVKADTYSLTIPSNITSLTSSDFNTMINTLNNTSISRKNYCFISWTNSTTNPYKVKCGETLTYNANVNRPGTFNLGSWCRAYYYNSDFTSLTQEARDFNCSSIHYSYISSLNENTSQHMIFLYTSPTWYYPNNDYIINYTYIDKVYTMPLGSDMKIYTIKDMYEDYNTDPYPLFTSFFDIVIEKLQLICEFFTSSYIYLSIFVIFIFYFCVLLLRRLL